MITGSGQHVALQVGGADTGVGQPGPSQLLHSPSAGQLCSSQTQVLNIWAERWLWLVAAMHKRKGLLLPEHVLGQGRASHTRALHDSCLPSLVHIIGYCQPCPRLSRRQSC